MGLSSSSLNAFRVRVDATLTDLFPASLILPGNLPAAASGVGGKAMADFISGGEKKEFSFAFRVPTTAGWTPAVGQKISWVVSESQTILMELSDYSIRPHEAVTAISCKYRKP